MSAYKKGCDPGIFFQIVPIADRSALRGHEEAKPLKELRPALPPELEQVVNRALKKDPNDRYASAAEISRDLKKQKS